MLNVNMNMLPPFRLYGLIGCPHCVEAEAFLREKGVPFILIIANGDPIADAGIKAVLKSEVSSYPMLVCTFNNQLIEGFKKDEYERLTSAYTVLFGTSTSSLPNSGQQSSGETPSKAAQAPAGIN